MRLNGTNTRDQLSKTAHFHVAKNFGLSEKILNEIFQNYMELSSI